MQQIAHSAGELGADFLRLVAHVVLGELAEMVIWLQHACQHADEGRLARAVLAQHDQDL